MLNGLGAYSIKKNQNKSLNLKYGVGKELEDEVKNFPNQNLEIEIEKDKTADIKLEFNFDENNLNLVDNIEIVLNEKSTANVIIKYKSNENIENYHNGIIRIDAKKDSKLNIICINMLNTNSNNFLSIENIVENNADVNYTMVDFGGKNSITNYYSNIVRKSCDKYIRYDLLRYKSSAF